MADGHEDYGRRNREKTGDSEDYVTMPTKISENTHPSVKSEANLRSRISGKRGDESHPTDDNNQGYFFNNNNNKKSSLCTRHQYKNISEYTSSCRTWLWKNQYMQYCYQMNNYNNSMMSMYLMSSLSSSYSQQQQQSPIYYNTSTSTNRVFIQQPQVAAAAVGSVYRIPPIWKRVVAELMDFFLLLLIKVGVTCVLVDITGGISGLTLEEMMTKLDLHPLNLDLDHIIATGEIDYEKMIALTTEVVVMEVINRVFISIFEAMCLRHGVNMVGGSTPGKRLMGLCVVSCTDVQELGESTIRVTPAGNIGFWNALVRSVIKNFSLAFLFPLCLTAVVFQHGRAVYDILANSVVVEMNVNNNENNQANQRRQ